ncbi:MAG TPA: hypothetical protein VKR58_10035 [Aquella sp.]|nr:hypothetical protein [Aquella sp.]
MKVKKSAVKKTLTKSLKDLIESTQWVNIVGVSRYSATIPHDGVGISFTKNTPNANDFNLITVRFGEEVLNKLGWKGGDKIVSMHDPDDYMNFLLVKCETGAGRTLMMDNGLTKGRVKFIWNRPFKLDHMPVTLVEYQIYKNYINFRVNHSSQGEE